MQLLCKYIFGKLRKGSGLGSGRVMVIMVGFAYLGGAMVIMIGFE